MERHEKNWLEACDLLAVLFSTCSRRQYFSVVLAPNKRVAGIGYNGGPPGTKHCIDGGCPHANDGSTPGLSYDNCIAQHAEAGALLWSDATMRQGGTLIVNGPPCFGCAKLIASSGVKRVVFYRDDNYTAFGDVQSFLLQAGLEVVMWNRPKVDQ
jgi:dCMP deaminase